MASEAGCFRRDDFFADVVNAVNDLHVDGFNALEEQIARLLNLSTEDELAQLKGAVDAVFVKVQTAADKNLQRWEKYCETNCFRVPESIAASEIPEQEEQGEIRASSSTTDADIADLATEAELDTQLSDLRSRILSVRRESAKLRKEYQTLESWLSSKRAKVEAVNRAANLLDERKFSTIEEISRAVRAFRERMKNEEPETVGELTQVDAQSKAAFAKLLDAEL